MLAEMVREDEFTRHPGRDRDSVDNPVHKLEEFWNDLASPKLSSLASWPIYWIDYSSLFTGWW
jgi:hypothetical protein